MAPRVWLPPETRLCSPEPRLGITRDSDSSLSPGEEGCSGPVQCTSSRCVLLQGIDPKREKESHLSIQDAQAGGTGRAAFATKWRGCMGQTGSWSWTVMLPVSNRDGLPGPDPKHLPPHEGLSNGATSTSVLSLVMNAVEEKASLCDRVLAICPLHPA